MVAGSGDINNGTVFGKEIPDTFPGAGIKSAPRLGFGWDVFGNGKTAVRGGFGTSYNRLGDGQYRRFYRGDQPDGQPPMDDDRRSLQRAVA